MRGFSDVDFGIEISNIQRCLEECVSAVINLWVKLLSGGLLTRCLTFSDNGCFENNFFSNNDRAQFYYFMHAIVLKCYVSSALNYC